MAHKQDCTLRWPLRPAQGDSLVVCYLRDVHSVLQLRSLARGSLLRDIPLPGIGCIRSCTGRRKETEMFFSYTDPVSLTLCLVHCWCGCCSCCCSS